MPHRVIARDVCRKHGYLLTCYVNGKKRFRALSGVKPPTDFKIDHSHSPRATDGQNDRADAVGL